jgi:hypothetical protein
MVGLSAAWSEPAPLRTPGGLLGAGCALTAGLLLAWVWLGALLCALGRLPGAVGRVSSGLSRRVAPAVLRTSVIAALGGSLVAGSAGVASADPVGRALPQPGWAAVAVAAVGSLRGSLPGPGWTPVQPAAPPTTPPADIGLVSALPAPGRTVDEHVAVRRGETLWAIAARHLGPGTTPAEVARAWPRWYAANRQVIGPDPDLVRPGQLLRPPTDHGPDRALPITTRRGRP